MFPNFGEIAAMGGKVQEFIEQAKSMLAASLNGIKTLGDNQVSSHNVLLLEIQKVNVKLEMLEQDLSKLLGEPASGD